MYFQKCKENIQKYFAILRYNGANTVHFFPLSQLTSSLAKKKAKTELCRTPLLGLEPETFGIRGNLLTTRPTITCKTSRLLEVFIS